MAENKKSFVLYCDLIHTVSKMPKEKAGELFIHILEYVNDLEPETDDLIIQLTFEPIKQSLKRDLQKYERIREKNIQNANIRWNKNNATASDRIESDAKNAVSDNDSVSVKDIVINKINNIEERKLKFASTLKPFLDLYGKDLINEFYKYWTEPNKSNTKFKQELEKTWSLDRRLETWAKNDTNFNKNKNGKQNITSTDEFQNIVKTIRNTSGRI
jgi:hypothetical protein